VYDNQGIHRIVQSGRYACHYIITSDAGAGFKGTLNLRNTVTLLIQTVDVFMARIKKTQMVQDIYDNTKFDNREIAYFSLGWDAENLIPGFIDNLAKGQITQSVITALQLKTEWVADQDKYRDEISQ
jgi:NTE family protein